MVKIIPTERDSIKRKESNYIAVWFLKTSSAARKSGKTSPGRVNEVDFELGKRRRYGYTALFLSRRTRGLRDASLRDRAERTADVFFDCLGWTGLAVMFQ